MLRRSLLAPNSRFTAKSWDGGWGEDVHGEEKVAVDGGEFFHIDWLVLQDDNSLFNRHSLAQTTGPNLTKPFLMALDRRIIKKSCIQNVIKFGPVVAIEYLLKKLNYPLVVRPVLVTTHHGSQNLDYPNLREGCSTSNPVNPGSERKERERKRERKRQSRMNHDRMNDGQLEQKFRGERQQWLMMEWEKE